MSANSKSPKMSVRMTTSQKELRQTAIHLTGLGIRNAVTCGVSVLHLSHPPLDASPEPPDVLMA